MTAADILAIREATGLSQARFAAAYRLSLATYRGWESGRRRLDQAALALLTAIGRDHEIMRELLAEGGKDG